MPFNGSVLPREIHRPAYSDTKQRTQPLLRSAFGAWKDCPSSGEEYVESLRGGLNDRLERLGWS